METKFKPSDDVLRQLVTARREEVVKLQRSEAERLNDLETRGQARILDLKKSLPSDIVSAFDSLDGMHSEAEQATKSNIERVKTKLMSSKVAPENETALHPGVAGGHLAASSGLGWFTPYYGTLHGSDGSVYWQGYNPGNIDLSDSANGVGTGLFGSGSASFTVYMDWWFSYKAPQNRNYGHTIWVPFHGFYILYADDGFWDSKETHARIDL